jgi:flagellar biosynthesis/type III secretory pathway ATPase
MRRKVVMLRDGHFVMERGHPSPVRVWPTVNVLRSIEKMRKGYLYRDCPECSQRLSREKQSLQDQQKMVNHD